MNLQLMNEGHKAVDGGGGVDGALGQILTVRDDSFCVKVGRHSYMHDCAMAQVEFNLASYPI